MSEAHVEQMNYLLIFIGAFLFVIVGVLALSLAKKKKHKLNDTQGALTDVDVVLKNTETIQTTDQVLPSQEVSKILNTVEQANQSEKFASDEVTLKQALKKTEENFFGRIRNAFSSEDKKQVLSEIEEVLYTSDLGPSTVQKLLDVVEGELSSKQMKDLDAVKLALKNQMLDILKPMQAEALKIISSLADVNDLSYLFKKNQNGPTVLMIVGVNGAGKTTTIGKLSARLASLNKKVLVAAGDTFRAAAGGQLKEWTFRAQQEQGSQQGYVEIFWPENTTDPSAVAFDAVNRAKSQNFDFVLIDTAGRLHTQAHLMDELKKVKRVMTKVIPDAPHETWIVLDANSGQNALLQAKEFNQALQLTGVILTKMDGTAKGGVALGVVDQVQVPIKLIGVGEKINDLKHFNYQEYVDSILGL